MTQAISASKQASNSNPETPLPARWNIKQLLPWLLSWEIYLVLVIAGFLRLYQINTSEFDGDQSTIFGLAREAVHFGLLPIVSNRASIGIENPPAVIYLLMIPVALSANPLWAAVMVGFFEYPRSSPGLSLHTPLLWTAGWNHRRAPLCRCCQAA